MRIRCRISGTYAQAQTVRTVQKLSLGSNGKLRHGWWSRAGALLCKAATPREPKIRFERRQNLRSVRPTVSTALPWFEGDRDLILRVTISTA